ncbi:helix-turn-helix domain-containing protein [Aeromonas encheleia]|uniref:Helix-turn-helix domain-containing protein n=1 Tax=Aeromonas encheleia TaxID=73010 RepID=A0AAE9MDX4_9GAMM|nr:helix-turn-helix domain-containing protein [Aeromonas encheleia]USV55841.1 helix-turn-helix domain-containing protein [Aeromonas encheleia]
MRNQKNNSNFFRAFDDIYKIKKIKNLTFNLNHKSVYCFLLNYQMMSGKVFPSYKFIQDNLGIGSDNTVKKYLDELEEMGLVKATSRKGTSKIFELVSLDDFKVLDEAEAQQTKKKPNNNFHKQSQPAAAEEGINVIRSKAQIIDVETANFSNSKGYRDSEVEDDFLVDCAVSRDADFEGYAEQYQEPTKQPPKPVTSVARTGKVGDCKKCKSCESDPWGNWYCNNDGCENSEPPF